MRLATVLCAAMLAGGCAVGNQHVYHDGTAEIGASGNTTVAVATQDLRPYVASGEKASGTFLIEQAKLVATNVTGLVIKGSGHWLMDEARDQVVPHIATFLNTPL